MKTQDTFERPGVRHGEHGRSVIEALVVIAIVGVLSAVSIPQLISSRRLVRSAALPRELVTQLRYTRQQAMSQRQAFTFQYTDSTKQIAIIDHNNVDNPNPGCNFSGAAIMAHGSYPNTPCSTTVLTVPLTGRIVMPAAELSFGVPPGVSVTTLSDNTAPTALTGGRLNITFQPNGTVIDGAGNFANRTLFFYNNKAARETASAISVLGAAGRIKLWRYNIGANNYAE